ncbi:MAG: DUF393 domain-containing protein [Phycisphaerae bacterium]|nr:DUF393 domain-containing protein [Phycisphaerae bacterium]NUQ46984.1 DUF393 domain-containing protein [Phycisphaerae bacterium]
MNAPLHIAVEAPRKAPGTPLPRDADIVFYDGHCGLCHATVRFILARDGPIGAADAPASTNSAKPPVPDDRSAAAVARRAHRAPRFLFSPLQGRTIREAIADDCRATLPDSVAVLTPEGRLFVRSAAVVRILHRLGGPWRPVARLLGAIPRPVADAGYRLIARIRRMLFHKPDRMCPVIPDRLRDRFLP